MNISLIKQLAILVCSSDNTVVLFGVIIVGIINMQQNVFPLDMHVATLLSKLIPCQSSYMVFTVSGHIFHYNVRLRCFKCGDIIAALQVGCFASHLDGTCFLFLI